MITVKFNDLTLEEIQALIKQGKIFDYQNGHQWFGDLNMFLNKFPSLCIEDENEVTYEPITADWGTEDIDLKDKMEEIDEHIMLDNFDCGYNFFGGS